MILQHLECLEGHQILTKMTDYDNPVLQKQNMNASPHKILLIQAITEAQLAPVLCYYRSKCGYGKG